MLYASESVSKGHPDKIADQISDAIVDAYIKDDRDAKVACEVLVSDSVIILAGEISSSVVVDSSKIVTKTLHEIFGESNHNIARYKIQENFTTQSKELYAATIKGASDQTIVYGYACDDTLELMPLPITLAHLLIDQLHLSASTFNFLLSDAKSQVTICYDDIMRPVHVSSVVLSVQHKEHISQSDLQKTLSPFVKAILPQHLLTNNTTILINPAGPFIVGGPSADTGLTGRKQIVDTYGGIAHHGGGAFSGKDPSKIDRSAAYLARYIAKHIVACKLAKRCEVHLAYAIGIAEPIAISINTYNNLDKEKLIKAVRTIFDLSSLNIASQLKLKRPIFQKTAYLGHFGRKDPDFTWEYLDKTEQLSAFFS